MISIHDAPARRPFPVVTRIPARLRHTPTGKHNDGAGQVSWLPGLCSRPPSRAWSPVACGRALPVTVAGTAAASTAFPKPRALNRTLGARSPRRQSASCKKEDTARRHGAAENSRLDSDARRAPIGRGFGKKPPWLRASACRSFCGSFWTQFGRPSGAVRFFVHCSKRRNLFFRTVFRSSSFLVRARKSQPGRAVLRSAWCRLRSSRTCGDLADLGFRPGRFKGVREVYFCCGCERRFPNHRLSATSAQIASTMPNGQAPCRKP